MLEKMLGTWERALIRGKKKQMRTNQQVKLTLSDQEMIQLQIQMEVKNGGNLTFRKNDTGINKRCSYTYTI